MLLSWLASKVIGFVMARTRGGDVRPTLLLDAPDVTLTFPGDNSWSGVFRGKDEVERWLRRLARVGLQTFPDEVVAKGFPWNMTMCIRGHDYLHRVLMRPQRDAQRLVIEKTRFFGEGSTGQLFQAKLATIKARTVEESIEAGSILCGSPQSVVKQMKKIHGEVGNGVFSLNFKVGDVPEGIVRHGMELFRDHVLPEMRAV